MFLQQHNASQYKNYLLTTKSLVQVYGFIICILTRTLARKKKIQNQRSLISFFFTLILYIFYKSLGSTGYNTITYLSEIYILMATNKYANSILKNINFISNCIVRRAHLFKRSKFLVRSNYPRLYQFYVETFRQKVCIFYGSQLLSTIN